MNAARHWFVLAICLFLWPVGRAQDARAGASEELADLLQRKGHPEQGKAIFPACQDCHRKDASGRANGVFPRLAGQHAPVLLKQISDIRAGRRHNPRMEPIVAPLSREEIADVVAYIHSLPVPAGNGKGPGTGLARGKELYERDCMNCHGANGEGNPDKFYPMVAAQHYRYLLREVLSIREGERRNSDPEMVKKVKPYSPADIEAVADYMSQLPPPAGK